MKRIISTVVVGLAMFGFALAAPAAHANQAPVAKAVFLINGVKAGSMQPVVPNGSTLHLVVDGSASSDADGWTTPGTGVSQGGSCKLYRGSSVVDSVQNPASPADCKFDLGTVTVSNSNVTQFSYGVSVVDAAGAKSSASASVGMIIHRPGAIVSVSGTGVTQNGYQNNNFTITVPKGVPVQLYGDGSQSWSPSLTSSYLYAPNNGINAWNDPVMGISSGGSCAWNTSLAPGAVYSGSYDRVISNPSDPSACGKGIDLGIHTFQTSGTYPLLKITDNTGMVSYAAVQINAATPPANKPPVAVAKMIINGGVASGAVTVAAGTSANVVIDASASTDPDGWTTALTGVSQGGKCEINTALSQANPAVFAKTVTNPGSASLCNQNLGQVTFPATPGTYTYSLVRITDDAGAVSNIGTVTVTVTSGTTNGNAAPIAVARASIDGGTTWSNTLTVTQGSTHTVLVDGTGSSDPDGWKTPITGVSSGVGRCSINSNFTANSFSSTVDIFTPATPADCKLTYTSHVFNDSPGTYTFPVLYIQDASAARSAGWGSITVKVVSSSSSNQSPVAVSQVSGDNGPYASEVWVGRGVPTRIQLSASQSSDPDGWTTAGKGVSNGGKCEWNTDLNQGVTTYEKTISNPSNPSACNVDLGTKTFNDAPGRYVYPVLRITDATGGISNVASITVVVLSNDPTNIPPIAVAQFTENGGAPSPHIYVTRGAPVRIGLDASASSDPNGWNTPTTGVANGGSCQWNTNLDQSNPTPFQKIISNPSSPSACNVDLGTLVFNDPPGTYTYTLLRIIDASGAISPIAVRSTNSSLVAKVIGEPAYAQSSDGTALVTVVDGPTPSPTTTVSASPTCNPFGYNPDCPPPTPTPTPTPSITPCIPGEVCNTPTPTPCVPGEVCDTPTPSPSPSESPSPTPTPCSPLDIACIISNITNGGTDGGISSGSTLAATITNAIARMFGLHPDIIQALLKAKGSSLAATLAALATALSAPFLAANILPSVAQWGQFFGSIFTVHRRKDRWGIVVDSDLGKPIANAVVQVFDAKFNQLKETQITGPDGQFGFLLPVGQYYIIASEAGFTFPAHKRPPVQLRENERVYLGEGFTISEQDPEKIPHIVVPMDREQEVPATKAIIKRYWENLLMFVDRVGFAFLFIGGGINTYLVLLNPGKLNIFFEALYLILFGLKLYIMLSHQRGVGTVIDRSSRKPMDLAIVRLYNAKTNRIVQTRVTNSIGRFFLLVPRGEYTISVSKQGYKTLLIDKVQIKGRSSKALGLDFSLDPQ